MSRLSEQRKKRYAEDPKYREKILAANRASHKKNKKKVNARRRKQRKRRYAEDPEYRERTLASNRACNKKNAKKLNARRRERRAADPELRERENARRRVTSRERQLKHDYGLTLAEFHEMVRRQNGRCPICDREAELCVDHCHVNDMVRLLLCRNCNLGLGYFEDNPKLLAKGKDYVEIFQKLAELLKAAGILPKERRGGRKKGLGRAHRHGTTK